MDCSTKPYSSCAWADCYYGVSLMNIRRFRSENLAFEKTSGIFTGDASVSSWPIPPPLLPWGKSHIKVKGMLVRKLKI